MIDDPQKIIQDDGAWLDKELEEVHRLLGDLPKEAPAPQAAPVRNFANGYGTADYEDEQDEAEDNELSQKRTIRNLVVFALLELAGILGILGYWALKLL